jgi:hypothetical protein
MKGLHLSIFIFTSEVDYMKEREGAEKFVTENHYNTIVGLGRERELERIVL